MHISKNGWQKQGSPFHEGEREIQERLGLGNRIERHARQVIRPYLPEQHRQFYSLLPFITVGHVDHGGRPWASALTGAPGFIRSPDPETLSFEAGPHPGDPLATSLAPGLPLGFVGLEFSTRRRNRVNGVVGRMTDNGFSLTVDQSFGNCPQYIQTREFRFSRPAGSPPPVPEAETFQSLPADARQLISTADTFFIASAGPAHDGSPDRGVDASHRGGRPGFVKLAGNSLTVPDFSGNKHFNTLGNLILDPRAGLMFPDFETGDILQLTGRVEILWDGPEVAHFEGSERAWRFTIDHGHWLRDAMPLRWTFGDYSPNSLQTGNWQEADQARITREAANCWRDYKITRIIKESASITSFHLTREDDAALPPFKPGQFLSLRVPGRDDLPVRNYSLSSAPSDPEYRISVKAEPDGKVSPHLHERMKPGDILSVRGPHGTFTLDQGSSRPAVLLAAGVGITPMVSMIRHHFHQVRASSRNRRPLTLIHASRNKAERAFFEEIPAQSTGLDSGLRLISALSRPEEGLETGHDYSVRGRIGTELLQAVLPLDDYEFYLCGPSGFMQDIYDILTGLGVADNRIRAEAFGQSSLRRKSTPATAGKEKPAAPEQATVRFRQSGQQTVWTPADGSLLEFAEARGLAPAYGCRNGSCGSCGVPVTSGKIHHDRGMTAPLPEGQALLCCARPADANGIELDL